jgi:hypothetical protein
MGISFYVRFRHLLLVLVFLATILVFQSYWKTFSLLDLSSRFIGNNVTFQSNSREGEIFESKSFEVENYEKQIHTFNQKILLDDSTQKVREFDGKHQGKEIPSKGTKVLNADWSIYHDNVKKSSNGSGIQSMEIDPQNGGKPQQLKASLLNSSTTMQPTSLTQLNSQLIHSFNSSSMV